jgi:hypothetical protein
MQQYPPYSPQQMLNFPVIAPGSMVFVTAPFRAVQVISAQLKSPQAFLPYVFHLLRFRLVTELNAGLRKVNKNGDRGKVSLVELRLCHVHMPFTVTVVPTLHPLTRSSDVPCLHCFLYGSPINRSSSISESDKRSIPRQSRATSSYLNVERKIASLFS